MRERKSSSLIERGWGSVFVLSPLSCLSPWMVSPSPLMGAPVRKVAASRTMNAFSRLISPSAYPLNEMADVGQLAVHNGRAGRHLNLLSSYAVATDVARAQLQQAISAAKNSGGILADLYSMSKLNDYAIARALEKEKNVKLSKDIRRARLDMHLSHIPHKVERQLALWRRRDPRHDENEDEDINDLEEETPVARKRSRKPKKKVETNNNNAETR